MSGSLKTLVAVSAVAAAVAAGSAVYAQPESKGTEVSRGMMQMQKGQGGMMDMMQQMSSMMDACTKMMQGMAERPAPEAPKKQEAPPKQNG